jgi:undecaprenyl-diphosphatase
VSGRLVTARGEQSPRRRPVAVAATLLAGWLILLGLMLMLGALLSRVERGSAFERADAGVPHWLAARRTDVVDTVSTGAAELGNTAVVLVLAVLASAVAAFVWRCWRPVLVIAVALAGEVAIFLTTSAVIDRPRPPVAHLDAELPPTSSFPSGHTAAAICLYGAVAALVLASTPGRRRRLVVGCAVALVVVVALARLYRGAHYPTDVLGSLVFALPWLLLVVRLVAPGSRHSRGAAPARPGEEDPPA